MKSTRSLALLAAAWLAASSGLSAADAPATPATPAAPPAPARAPLKLSVDTRPINRDASDRVSYAAVLKKTAGSVAYIYTTRKVQVQNLQPFLNDPALRRYLEDSLRNNPNGSRPRARDRGDRAERSDRNGGGENEKGAATAPHAAERTQRGLGSGVVLSADGYILTNSHVVEDAEELKVAIGDAKKRYDAKVVGRDAFTDIAVLKIDATGLAPAAIGDSDNLQVGDVVLATGNPFGVGQAVSRGIVSAFGRGPGPEENKLENYIQTDAAINAGNSGGALLDSDGRVVGLNTAGAAGAPSLAGVGCAIPINLARATAEQIIATGKVERGFLGVSPQDLTDDLAAEFKAESGALLTEISPDSPAEKSGLKAGDVIVKVNGNPIRDARHLLLIISQLAPDTKIALDYLRDGKPLATSVVLGRRAADATATEEKAETKDVGVLNGVGVTDITAEVREQFGIPRTVKGAIVTSVEPTSPSYRQGLREGDVILDLDRKPVENAAEAVKLSEEIKGPKVLVRFWREGRPHYLSIDESK